MKKRADWWRKRCFSELIKLSDSFRSSFLSLKNFAFILGELIPFFYLLRLPFFFLLHYGGESFYSSDTGAQYHLIKHDFTLGTKLNDHIILIWISVINCLRGAPHLYTLFRYRNEELKAWTRRNCSELYLFSFYNFHRDSFDCVYTLKHW